MLTGNGAGGLGKKLGSGASNGVGANGSGANGAGADGAGAGQGSGGETFIGGNTDGSTGNSNGQGGSCPGISAAPEQILVDATVTDTIVTYSPVALYIMQDRSGSTVTGFPTGNKDSWKNATAALTGFVQGGSSVQGIDVGLGFFPPLTGNNACAAGDECCNGDQCYIPAVPIGPISQTGPQIAAAYTNNTPGALNFTPTECALRGMIKQCEDYTAKASEPCVAVLITDGTPDQCDGDVNNLQGIVADGLTHGVKTFVLQMPGVDASFLDPLAAAGGTTKSIDVTAGSSAILSALDGIRNKVATSTSQHVHKTVSAPLPCQWTIPSVPQGQTFDPTKVNMLFTPPGGGTATPFGFVDSKDKCGTSDGAWYYLPDNTNPTQVLVCPSTCDRLKAANGARVDIQFDCVRHNLIQ